MRQQRPSRFSGMDFWKDHAVRFLLRHAAYGLAAALSFGTAVLYLDIGNIRTLAENSSDGVWVIVLMYFGLFVTFGSAAMGIGIMNLGEDEN